MSKIFTSNDNGNKGIVITESRNSYEFPTSAEYNRRSKLVTVLGLIILVAVLIFVFKWFSSAALVAAIVPGNPFDEGQKDDDLKNIILGILGVIVLGLLPFTLF